MSAPLNKAQQQEQQRRMAAGMVGLVAVALVGLGGWAIVTGEYFGITTRLHGADVALTGARARWLGASLAALGVAVLAFPMPSRAAAIRWGVIWVVLAAIAFWLSLR